MPEPVRNAEKAADQEIEELERLLAEKKQALAVEGAQKQEHEVFREAFREAHGEALAPQAAPAASPPPSHPIPPEEAAKHAAALASQSREEQLESLIALAFSKGIGAAAAVARHAAPWLMDELHDRLCDRYYQHLITSRQLKAL